MASVPVLTSMGIYIFDDSDRFSLGGERADPTLSLVEYKIQRLMLLMHKSYFSTYK